MPGGVYCAAGHAALGFNKRRKKMKLQTRFFEQLSTKTWILLLLIVTVSLGVACQAEPAAPTPAPYPTEPITYLIPFDPGGQSDRMARLQAPMLKGLLEQEILIDYKAGEGGALGWAEVARFRPADGYTMVAVNLSHIVLQPMFNQADYQTDELECLVVFARTPIGLAVLNSSPYQTLEEFLDAAKAKPGELSIAGFAEYTAVHMAFLQLEKVTGTEFKYVPFSGSAPQMTAFLGGDTVAVIANSDDLLKNKDQVRVLAMAEEFPGLPDAPTFKDKGVDVGPVVGIDRSVAVRAGTPDDIVQKLEAAFLEIAGDPEFQAAMEEQGFVPVTMNRAETKAYLEDLKTTYKQLADLTE
jgi:tripartite-type tricarboxylate transporter receptor subunit TctC